MLRHARIPLSVTAFVAIVVWAAVPASAGADKVILKNGEVIEGEVLGEEGEKYVIKVGSGKMRIPKTQVAEIRMEELPEEPALEPEAPPLDSTSPDEAGSGGTSPSTSGTTPSPPPSASTAPPPPKGTSAPETPAQWRIPTDDEIVVPAEKMTPQEDNVLKHLMEELAAPDDSRWRIATRHIVEMKTKALHPLTTILARSTNATLVKRALTVLSQMPDPRTLPGIKKRVFDRDDSIVRLAAMTLPHYGEPGIPILVDMLQDGSAEIRRETLVHLASCPRTAEVLGGYLFASLDRDAGVRREAETGLNSWDGDSLRKGAGKIVPLLKHSEATARFWGVRLAGKGGLVETAATIVNIAAKDPDAVIRHEAVIALGGLGAPLNEEVETKVLDLLRQCLESQDPEDRFCAIQAMIGRRDEVVIDYLIEFLTDESDRVRAAAHEGLKTLSGQKFRPDKQTWINWWELMKKEGGE